MRRGAWVTGVVLLLVVAGIVGALMVEASRGPTFRAADHADYEECLRGIPAEWSPGSLQRQGAEQDCHYVHRAGTGR